MKRSALFATIGAVFILATVLDSAVPIAEAATPSATGGQALEISPPLLTLNANPGQTIKVPIKVRDISSGPLLVSNEVDDFLAAGEDGTPKILLNNQAGSDPFTLKDWVTPLPGLTLSPQQIVTLNVVISVPKNASPGGHYGVIRFTGTPPQLNGTGVSLSASLGALVLLTVNGKLNDQLAVQEFSVNSRGKTGSVFESAPLSFTVRLNNKGNIQEQPTGQVIVTDMFGKTIAGVRINAPPHDILPDSIRKFTGPLDNSTIMGNKFLFGRYHAYLILSYGVSTAKVLDDNLTFWVIPYKLILGAIVVLIAGFFALRFLIGRYNKHIIGRAQKLSERGKTQKRR